LLRTVQVLHLCGSDVDEALQRAYERAGVRAIVHRFLHRIGLAWGAADLALSRAGANSVAEAAANAVPTIFVPYPYHRDLHQRHNAEPLVTLGGAVMVDDRIEPAANMATIGTALQALLHDGNRRDAMRAALRRHPPRDA